MLQMANKQLSETQVSGHIILVAQCQADGVDISG